MPKFQDFLSLSNYNEYTDLINQDAAFSSRAVELVNQFINSVERYLLAMKAEGLLNVVTGMDNRSLRNVQFWNAFTLDADPLKPVDRELSQAFTSIQRMDAFLAPKADINSSKESNYNNFCQQMNEGCFEHQLISSISDQCQKTGQRVSYELKNWNFVPVSPGRLNNKKLEILGESPILETCIKLKTGRLLIADWFRIEAFTSAVRNGSASESINSEEGREREQRRFAKEHNFLSINIDDISPNLSSKDGVLVGGYADTDIDAEELNTDLDAKDLGSVCTDFWAVTVIERQNLVGIITESGVSETEAIKIVSDYVDNNDVIEVSVKPGDFYAYSSGDIESFQEKIKEYDVDNNGIDEPYFILSDKRLELLHQPSLS